MIISASRRTDIPSYYGKWFMKRIREGCCQVRNPYNAAQLSQISLLPQDVDLFVFWTRDAAPFMEYLPELDGRGYRYCFLYTHVQYPPVLEPAPEPLTLKIDRFAALAETIGPEKLAWRYDPIVLSAETGYEYHLEMFSRIAGGLKGASSRVIISFLDLYRKVKRRFEGLGERFPDLWDPAEEVMTPAFSDMMQGISGAARRAGMEVQSCAERIDLSPWGIGRGKCIDERQIRSLFGLSLAPKKDPGQRQLCGCIPSRDIGAYDTCPRGCLYCYANRRYAAVDEDAPFL